MVRGYFAGVPCVRAMKMWNWNWIAGVGVWRCVLVVWWWCIIVVWFGSFCGGLEECVEGAFGHYIGCAGV